MATVNDKGVAGDEGRVIAGEEEGGAGDVVRHARALDGLELREEGLDRLNDGRVVEFLTLGEQAL